MLNKVLFSKIVPFVR